MRELHLIQQTVKRIDEELRKKRGFWGEGGRNAMVALDEIKVFGSDLALEPTQWRKEFHEVIAIGVRKSDYPQNCRTE